MVRFGIVIPLRPKSESADWEVELVLLNRTLASVLKQTYTELAVFVVYTDQPTELAEDSRVHYVPFPYAFRPWEELPNKEDLLLKMKFKQKAARRWDKGRKVSYGSKVAKEAGCDYIMVLDSDDLLSKHFLHTLFSRCNEGRSAGWYMDCGYLYKEGASFLIKVPRHMTGLNGSTHVLRADLVRVPDFDSMNWRDYNQFTDHGWVRYRVEEEYGEKLEAIDRYMLVYVVHGSNMSGVYEKEYGFNIKAIVKRLARSRVLTEKKREEFNLVRVVK